MQFGLYEARGYDLPIIQRFDRLWRREVSPESPTLARGLLDIPLELREVTPRALRALRLLGVTHVLRGTTGRAADPPYRPTTPYEPLSAPGLSRDLRGPGRPCLPPGGGAAARLGGRPPSSRSTARKRRSRPSPAPASTRCAWR